MLPITYEFPFIFPAFCRWLPGFKPFLPLYAAYFLLSLWVKRYCLEESRSPRGAESGKAADAEKENNSKGKRGELFALGYILLIPLCAFQAITGGDETIFTEIAGKYLRYETVLYLVVLTVYGTQIYLFGKQKKLRQYVRIMDNIMRGMVMFSIGAALVAQQVDAFWWPNIICYVILGLTLALSRRWEAALPISEKAMETDAFRPVETYRDLLPQQQRAADNIADIIERKSKRSSVSICVTGKWGVGKTSVVNGVVDKLRGPNTNRKYECVYINAMELDTLSSLFDHVFSRIRDILKDRGLYVGVGSEYRKFIASAVGKMTDPSIATFLENRLFPDSDDYREQLRLLEECVCQALEEDTVLLIVDDVERCDENKARQFIAFIKEIAMMRGFVTIFITDLQYLALPRMDCGGGKNNDSARGGSFYYDKFFNYRVDVAAIEPKTFMERRDRKEPLQGIMADLGLRPCNKLAAMFEERLADAAKTFKEKGEVRQGEDKQKMEDRSDKLNQQCERFRGLLGLPRSLVKLYSAVERDMEKVRTLYWGPDGLSAETKQYFKDVRLDELLFLLEFVQACMPEEYVLLEKQGLSYFEHTDDSMSNQRELIISLGEGLLYTHSEILNIQSHEYHQVQAGQFVRSYLKRDLPKSVKSFDNREECWFAGIESGNTEMMEQDWLEMVQAVGSVLSWRKGERGEKYMRELISFARRQIDEGKWTLKDVFEIFNHRWRNEESFARKIPAMEILWDNFFDILNTASREMETLWHGFGEVYLWHRVIPVCRAASLLAPADNNWKAVTDSATQAAEILLVGKEPGAEKLDKLLDRLFLELVRIELPREEDVFVRLDRLIDIVKNYLDEYDQRQFKDMDEIVGGLSMMEKELRYFWMIQEQVQAGLDTDPNSIAVDLEHLDDTIDRFEEALNTEDTQRSNLLSFDLQRLFGALLGSTISLSDVQYNRLQEILTKAEKRCGSVLFFRKVLIKRRQGHGENSQVPRQGEARPEEKAGVIE